MMRASTLFGDADRKQVAAAVAAAEQRTSAEIIPVVATVSGRYDRAEDLVGVVVALLALAGTWLGFQGMQSGAPWAAAAEPALGLLPLLLVVLIGFLAGAAVATRVPALRLPFISASEMRAEVERAAAEAFYRFRVRGTAGGTGILIYVSVYEHTVRVLGDDAIAQHLGQDDWDAVRDLILDGLRNGRATDGLVRAIDKCGDLCAPHLPVSADDRDELSNQLRIID